MSRSKRATSFFLSFFLSFSALAQSPTPFELRRDQIFGGIDHTPITSGLLKDYALPLRDIGDHAGPPSPISPNDFRALYATLRSARVSTLADGLPMLSELNNRITTHYQTHGVDVVPLALFFSHYHLIRQDVSTFFNLGPEQQLSDITSPYPPGATTPYLLRSLMGAMAAKDHFNHSTVRFMLPSNLLIEHFDTDPARSWFRDKVQIDFGDGAGYRNITPDTPITINYLSAGPKKIHFRYLYKEVVHALGLSHERVMESTQWIQIDHTPATRYGLGPDESISLVADPALSVPEPAWNFGPANERGDLGVATGIMRIGFSESNDSGGRIRKPLLVVEGFDINFLITGTEDLTYRSFIRELNVSPRGLTNDLNDQLDDLRDYDLIYLDLNNPGRDIRNNALLVREALQQIELLRDVARPFQPTVVMGISMGGLLARYALAQMQNDLGENHSVRLLLTIDSPHRGANVPISAQMLLPGVQDAVILTAQLGLIDLTPMVNPVANALSCPAAEQMLLYRIPDTYDVTGGVYNVFLNTLYPTMVDRGLGAGCRFVAIANGSECGLSQTGPLAPTTPIFSIDASAVELIRNSAANWLWDNLNIAPWITSSLMEVFAVGGIPDLKATLRLDQAREGVSERIAYFHIRLQYRVLFGLAEIHIENLLKLEGMSRPDQLRFDNAPGGHISAPINVFIENASATPIILPAIEFMPQICFVPSFSALDVRGPYTNALLYNRYNTASVLPFSSVNNSMASVDTPDELAPVLLLEEINEFHTAFTPDNALFILNEIDALSPVNDCGLYCDTPPTLSMTIRDVCLSEPGLATVLGVPAGFTVTFEPAPGSEGIIELSPGLTPNTSFIHYIGPLPMPGTVAWVRATVNVLGCPREGTVLTQRVDIGLAQPPGLSDDPTTRCVGALAGSGGPMDYIYNLIPSPNADRYLWEVITPGAFILEGITDVPSNFVALGGTGTYLIRVTPINDCGIATSSRIVISFTGIACRRAGPRFTLSPNPATGRTEIAYKSDEEGPRESFVAILKNMQGEQLRQLSSQSGEPAILTLDGLRTGIYVVQVQTATDVEMLRLVVD